MSIRRWERGTLGGSGDGDLEGTCSDKHWTMYGIVELFNFIPEINTTLC